MKMRNTTKSRREKNARSAALGQSISNVTKKEILTVFVDQLVQKKLQSTKKQQRLDKNDYKQVYLKIQSTGINFLTLNGLKLRVLRNYKKLLKSCPPPPDETIVNANSLISSTPIGRPKDELLALLERNKEKAKNKITELFFLMHQETKKKGKKIKAFTYNRIMHKVMKEFNLNHSNFNFPYDSCKSRIQRGQILSKGTGRKSPLADIEPKFVDIFLSLSDIGSPVTVGESILLINSLIKDTPSQQRLIKFQQ